MQTIPKSVSIFQIPEGIVKDGADLIPTVQSKT
jgi:hypothetical protein